MAVGAAKDDIYDLATHSIIARGVTKSAPIELKSGEARVLVVIPAGSKRSTVKGVVQFDGVAVDYNSA